MYIMTYRAHFIHLNIDLYLLCINSYIAQQYHSISLLFFILGF